MTVPVVSLAKIGKIVDVEDLASIVRDRIVFVSQIQGIGNRVVIGSCRGKVLRKRVVRSELERSTAFVQAYLKTIVVGIIVVPEANKRGCRRSKDGKNLSGLY